jgi:hypothetical protein
MWEIVTSKDKPKRLLLYFATVESVYFFLYEIRVEHWCLFVKDSV